MKKIHTVLIVDDSEADHIIAGIAIEAYDASIVVHKAYDGQEALNLLENLGAPPDVILLDINMPGMNGHEFLAEYSKSSQPSSVIAMLTTSDQVSDREECFTYPFVKKYIVKPLDAGDIDTIAKSL